MKQRAKSSGGWLRGGDTEQNEIKGKGLLKILWEVDGFSFVY